MFVINTVVFGTNAVVLVINTVVFGTNAVVFAINTVVFGTNPVVFVINTVVFATGSTVFLAVMFRFMSGNIVLQMINTIFLFNPSDAVKKPTAVNGKKVSTDLFQNGEETEFCKIFLRME
ncbi:MAG: hypothetical protein JJE25_07795 [Bacteroidia bacterium]|nr:hypothetical protein [Bacteroidia bacterium]